MRGIIVAVTEGRDQETGRRPVYRIYIDEVGNPDLESSDNPNHRFLSLTGVILSLDYVKATLHPQIESLKAKYFDTHPDEPIVLHRKDLMNAKHPFRRLKDSRVRRQFDKDLLTLLASWQYTVVSICIDKKQHKKTYRVWTYDPYHYCLEVMLERFVLFLENMNSPGDVMAEARGGKSDMRLKKSFNRLWREGTRYVSGERFQAAMTSRQLKVKPKAYNISGLQLADLVAHPSRNEILKDHELLPRQIAPFASEVIKILQQKYYQSHDRTKVFGKKLLP